MKEILVWMAIKSLQAEEMSQHLDQTSVTVVS